MLKLGIIGTGSISHHFIEACRLSGAYQLAAVYSRHQETAETFITNYSNCDTFTDLREFLTSDLDIIYIASPNSIHFEQAKAAIKAKKHVIVEKPAFSTPKELQEILQLAKDNHVFFFEAARNIHEKALETVKLFLSHKTIIGASFNYAKYSSKMKALLNSEHPNIFSSKFSGGALADLGVYPIYAAIYLFGKPLLANYTASLLDSGVDINGDGNLIYPDFRVSIKTGKNYETTLPAEIYTTDGTLILNHIQAISSATFKKHDGSCEELSLNNLQHPMLEEVICFSNIIKSNDLTHYHSLLVLAQVVSYTLFTMRQDAGIRFEADYD